MKRLLFFLAAVSTFLFAPFADHVSEAQIVLDENRISPEAAKQIYALTKEKESRTPAQKKIDSQLLIADKISFSKV